MAKSRQPFRVGISGSYGGFNLGDEAILKGIVKELRGALPVEITVFSRDAEDTGQRHQVERAVPVRKLSRDEVLPEIQRLDLLPFAYVARDCQKRALRAGQLLRRRLQFILAARRHHDAAPRAGKRCRKRASKAAAAAGYQHDFVLQVGHAGA